MGRVSIAKDDAEVEVQETAIAPSTVEAAADTVAEAAPVRVHLDRALGGRYVSLGGGERLFVQDESTAVSGIDPRIDDAEFQRAQNPQESLPE